MLVKTRHRIIQKAVELFNEHGFYDVRIRDISNALQISPGSISYHFKNKEDLVNSVFRYMLKTLDVMSIEDRIYLKKGNELILPSIYAEYMKKFRFFFQDTLDIIRTYPKIGDYYQKHVTYEIKIVRGMIQQGVVENILMEEQFEGQYEKLAGCIWQTMHFWFARNAILQQNEEVEAATKYVAMMLYPICTNKGRVGDHNIYSILGLKKPLPK